MSSKNPDGRLTELAAAAGLDLASVCVPGGAYSPAVRQGDTVYLSGQIPKVGAGVAFVGAVGGELPVDLGKQAAGVCALRLLGVLQSTLGSLQQVARIVRVNVFIQAAPGFDRHSEVADGASAVLADVLQCEAGHARTAVGVASLPRNASVEVDMTVGLAVSR